MVRGGSQEQRQLLDCGQSKRAMVVRVRSPCSFVRARLADPRTAADYLLLGAHKAARASHIRIAPRTFAPPYRRRRTQAQRT